MQRLSDPLFAVPFLGLLAVAGAAVVIAAGIHRRYGDEERESHERLGYLAGQGALLSFVPLGIAAAFGYAGMQARLARVGGTPRDPSLVGRIGGALPWEAVLWPSVAVLCCCVVGMVAALAVGVAREYGPLR